MYSEHEYLHFLKIILFLGMTPLCLLSFICLLCFLMTSSNMGYFHTVVKQISFLLTRILAHLYILLAYTMQYIVLTRRESHNIH